MTLSDRQFHNLAQAWAEAGVKAQKRFLLTHARDIWRNQNAGVPLARFHELPEPDAAVEGGPA